MISVCSRLGAVCPNKGYMGIDICKGVTKYRGATCVKCFKSSSETRLVVSALRGVNIRAMGYERLRNRGNCSEVALGSKSHRFLSFGSNNVHKGAPCVLSHFSLRCVGNFSIMRDKGCSFARRRLRGVGRTKVPISFSFSSSSARRCCRGATPRIACTFYSFSKASRRTRRRLGGVVSVKPGLTVTSEKTGNYVLCSKEGFCQRPTTPLARMGSALNTKSSLVTSFLAKCVKEVGGNVTRRATVYRDLRRTTTFTTNVYNVRNTFNCKGGCR